MILSGWILPNLVEGYTCRSYSGFKEHILVVQNYLKVLDAASREKIMILAKQIGISSLDDIAVFMLGWIKVSDYPFKTICYIAKYNRELIIQKYINLGYIPIELTPKYFIG